jgi:hypothetical protein
MIHKEIFGFIAIVISCAASINYIISILRGETKPHAFTWAIWSLIFGIVYVAQWKQGAGAGSWTTGVSAFLCLTIFILSLFRGEKNITQSDWVALVSALAIIPFWHFTHNALLAVVFATLIDACAYYPTIRKTWIRPYEENLFMYASDNIKWIFAFLAMGDFSATTLIYPIFCMTANSSLALMIFLRRQSKRLPQK